MFEGLAMIAENIIREAMDRGVFDNLAGKGKPLDLTRGPFEDPLAPTLRRILRDNGASHPLIEARQALEEEIEHCRALLRRGLVHEFRKRAAALNRDIKLNNLRSPIPNFQLGTIDIEHEIRLAAGPSEPEIPRTRG